MTQESSLMVISLQLLLSGSLLAMEDVPTPVVEAAPLDAEHREFAAVLSTVVKSDGVDYATLRRDHAALDRYRAQLATAPMPTDRSGTIAFFINAYNAQTLALVIAQLPTDPTRWSAWSIKDAGSTFTSVWKRYTFLVGGNRYTLDQIENAVLRPLGEPRIHFAINCASKSCPPIAIAPLRAATLDAQLEAASRAFAASASQLRLAGGVLRINPILDWFGGDFSEVGGVRAFLRVRVPAGMVADYLASDKPLRYFEYDWTLNLAGATP